MMRRDRWLIWCVFSVNIITPRGVELVLHVHAMRRNDCEDFLKVIQATGCLCQ